MCRILHAKAQLSLSVCNSTSEILSNFSLCFFKDVHSVKMKTMLTISKYFWRQMISPVWKQKLWPCFMKTRKQSSLIWMSSFTPPSILTHNLMWRSVSKIKAWWLSKVQKQTWIYKTQQIQAKNMTEIKYVTVVQSFILKEPSVQHKRFSCWTGQVQRKKTSNFH